MAYFIKFIKPTVLQISRTSDDSDQYTYYPIRLKTLATINSFLHLLDIDDKLHYLLSGYTLKIYVSTDIINIGNQKQFRDKIRQHRYKCHLENLCCSIICRNINRINRYYFKHLPEYWFKDNIAPQIFERSPLYIVDYHWEENKKLVSAYDDLHNYITLEKKYTQFFDKEELLQGGVSFLYAFDKNKAFEIEEDHKLIKLIDTLKNISQNNYWSFSIKYANFKNWVVISIYRNQSDLYNGSIKLAANGRRY